MFGTSGASKKVIVGMAVTPTLGLEACVYDKEMGQIVKYAQKFLEYNIASKEIQDPNAFRSAISDVLNDLDVDKDDANVFLVLPNVHFGFRSIDDLSVDNDAIESMILSEASESYIFKQEEPVSAWVDVNAKTGAPSKYIAHSSIQRKVVDAIQDAFMDVGVNIVGIEGSVSAIARGVALGGLCNDVISNNDSWDILLINPNGYAIFQMAGTRILDYIEVPFAIMSFEGDEVYSALSSAIGQYLPNYPAKKLVITSLTDNVSADQLKNEIVFDETIVTVDSNSFGRTPCVKTGADVVGQAANMSLLAAGAACPKLSGFATLNVLGNISYEGGSQYGTITINGNEIEVTSDWVMKTSMKLSVILGGLAILLCGTLFGTGQYFTSQKEALEPEISALKTEVEALQTKITASLGSLIKGISDNNKVAINYYDSLSSDIPQNVWLTYYVNKDGNDVGIEGYSIEINDIYEYYKSLKILVPKSSIKLNKLEVFNDKEKVDSMDQDSIVLGNGDDQQVFYFEISNTSYEKTFDTKGNNKTNQNAGSKPAYAIKVPDVPDVEINLKEIK